jgi:large subunit ribosomal protein L5
MARLREVYRKDVRPALAKRLGVSNPNALPTLDKITVSMGVGKAKENKKHMENAVAILARITGQKAVVTKSKVAVAQFHLREGMPVGCKVTLRGTRAWEFLDRLITVVIPRIRDFRGLPRTFDGHGNYSMGLAEQTVFPEVDGELIESPQGMNITMTFRRATDQGSAAFLEAFHFPFQRPEDARHG